MGCWYSGDIVKCRDESQRCGMQECWYVRRRVRVGDPRGLEAWSITRLGDIFLGRLPSSGRAWPGHGLVRTGPVRPGRYKTIWGRDEPPLLAALPASAFAQILTSVITSLTNAPGGTAPPHRQNQNVINS